MLREGPGSPQIFLNICHYQNIDLLLGQRSCGSKVRLDHAVQIRVVGTPQNVTLPNAREVDRVVAEAQLDRVIKRRHHLIQSPTFFRLTGVAPIGSVEHNAVAWFEWGRR